MMHNFHVHLNKNLKFPVCLSQTYVFGNLTLKEIKEIYTFSFSFYKSYFVFTLNAVNKVWQNAVLKIAFCININCIMEHQH